MLPSIGQEKWAWVLGETALDQSSLHRTCHSALASHTKPDSAVFTATPPARPARRTAASDRLPPPASAGCMPSVGSHAAMRTSLNELRPLHAGAPDCSWRNSVTTHGVSSGKSGRMLTFLTLFLGLVSGVRTVELAAGGDVAAIEVRLDGKAVGRVTSPPWSINVDFGDPPKPHELSAVAFAQDGKELAKVLQKINLPRSLAEATLTLVPGSGGKGRTARLRWVCAIASEPTRIAVTFDGRPIPSSDPARIGLPDFVPEQLHFLKADLDFPRNIAASAEITFGGQSRDETQAELTAIAVLSEKKKTGPVDGAFEAGGRSAEGRGRRGGRSRGDRDRPRRGRAPHVREARGALRDAAEDRPPLPRFGRLGRASQEDRASGLRTAGPLHLAAHADVRERGPCDSSSFRNRRTSTDRRAASSISSRASSRPASCRRPASQTPSPSRRSRPSPGTARAPSS